MVDLPRRTMALDGQEFSYLHDGEGSPVVLLRGTFWSRVWSSVVPRLAGSHAVFAARLGARGTRGSRIYRSASERSVG